MKYVFNPASRQINPASEVTASDPSLRDKVVSSSLYALVCQGKVSVEDIAAMFAVGKSPEILLKNHMAVKESPMVSAPANTEVLTGAPEAKKDLDDAGDGAGVSVTGVFDGKTLCSKTQPELLVIATTIGCPELQDPNFAPTRQNLIPAIKARADAAAAGTQTPANPANPPPAE